jgi:Uma2 family endonuclease
VHGFDHVSQATLQVMEVHDDADAVEFGGGDGEFYLPVVAVEGLEGGVVELELMGGGKLEGGGDLEGHFVNDTGFKCVEQHGAGATMDAMSIISNQPELGDRPDGAVYLPKRMSEAEFVEWCDDETWAEWVDGQVIVMSPVNYEHAKLTSFLIHLFRAFVDENDLGDIITEPFQIRFPKLRRRRSPDLIFISKNRIPELNESHFDGAPDLVIEIVSWESQNRDRRDKFSEYQSAGVREYWIVDPVSKTVEAHVLKGRTFVQFGPKAEVIRSKVLPGLYIRPSWLWRARFPSVSSLLKEMGGKK